LPDRSRALLWERAGAAAGIAFVAFALASFFVIPDSPPALDDPVGEIRSFYADNSSAFQASAFLMGLAGFFFLCFLGSLATVLGAAGHEQARTTVLAAGAVTIALAFASTAVIDTLATRIAAESDQAVIRALYYVQAFMFTFGNFAIAAFVGAVAIAAAGTRLLPPLVVWLGYALVPAWIVAGCGLFVESGAFSPTGEIGFVVVLVWFAWILALSASLLRRSGRATPVDAP
jgi:hypothetical protein